jgi:hypothetical protein
MRSPTDRRPGFLNSAPTFAIINADFVLNGAKRLPPKRLGLFPIPASCRLAKSLSYYEQMGWLVGAVGIEPTTFGLKGRCSTTELRP